MSPALPAALVAELSALLGAEGWRMDDSALEANAQDNSWRHQRPAAVAQPASIEQVQALVRACRAHHVALVARGAGTGTTGAAV
ncbi:MAG: FAD-binding protein, partial [Stenotrophomonas maltophilia]|nr:FAD-binding protein [Stenotrophomonas maltophilia]